MDANIAALDQLELGSPITAANLTMFPLLLREESAPGYLTLDEALAAGLASVTEVSESGSVPELLVKNGAAKPVLILDGEELVGRQAESHRQSHDPRGGGADAPHSGLLCGSGPVGAPLARICRGRAGALRHGPGAEAGAGVVRHARLRNAGG